MYGNLSKTIVTVPKSFHLSAHITSSTLAENRYKEPTINDTFSHLNKIKSRTKNRYFRLSEHFKENSPYKDLNFNNNKRYISPVLSLKPFGSLDNFLFGKKGNINKKIRKSISQAQLLSRTNSMNLSKVTNKEISKDDSHSSKNINIHIRNISIKKINNKFQPQVEPIEEKNNLSKINELLPLEDSKNINLNDEEIKSKNSEEEEKAAKEKYLKKLNENKPHNLEDLKKFLEMKYTDVTKPLNYLPKIGRSPNSISQDDLFKKTLTMKLNSLSMIKPEVKKALFKRKKNMILKRDYDMIRIMYNVRKELPIHFRNIISYEALAQE